MKDTTKKKLLVAVGALACVALAVGIVAGFGGQPKGDDPSLNTEGPDPTTPVVDIQEPETPTVNVKLNTGHDAGATADPGAGADNSGTEQTIQSDPVKPEAPEPPEAPAVAAQPEPEHTGDDVPTEERNQEAPPTYEETPTVTTEPVEQPDQNSEGAYYFPGFGYIQSGGEGTATQDESIYENGNKVGIMD